MLPFLLYDGGELFLFGRSAKTVVNALPELLT